MPLCLLFMLKQKGPGPTYSPKKTKQAFSSPKKKNVQSRLTAETFGMGEALVHDGGGVTGVSEVKLEETSGVGDAE